MIAIAVPAPGGIAIGTDSGGSDPPAGTPAVLVQTRPRRPVSVQVQPFPLPGNKKPSPFPLTLASTCTCVVPELAEVPVFRTVTVHVPLGVDVVCQSDRATHGTPPSPTDMTMSTPGGAAATEARAGPVASWARHTKTTANAIFVAFTEAR
jgi:hypothetical protein